LILPPKATGNKQSEQVKESVKSEPKRCFNCYSVSHTIQDCPNPKRKPGSCFNCGLMGHGQRDCKAPRSISATKGYTNDSSTKMIEINEQNNSPLMLNIDVECEEVKWTTDAIVDTGSPICIIKQSSVPPNVLVTPVSS